METDYTINPGGSEAVKQGCTCPVMDNAYGRGYMGGVKVDGETVFVYTYGCPVHDIPEEGVHGD